MDGYNYPYNHPPFDAGLNQTLLLPPDHPDYNEFDRLLYGEIPHQNPRLHTIPRSYPQTDFDLAHQLQSTHNDASCSYAGSSTPQAGSLPPNNYDATPGEEPPDYDTATFDTSHMDVSEGEDESLISSNQHESTLPTSIPPSAVGGSDNERQDFVRGNNQGTFQQQQYPARDATVGIGAALQYHTSPKTAPTVISPQGGYPSSPVPPTSWDPTTVLQMGHIRPALATRHENIRVSRSPSTRSKKGTKSRQPRKAKGKDVSRKVQRQALKAIKTEPIEDPHFLSPTSAISRTSESNVRFPPTPSNDERKHLEALLRNNSVDLIYHWLKIMGTSRRGSNDIHTPNPDLSDNFAQFHVERAACRNNADQKSTNRAPQSDNRKFGCTCGCGETFEIKWNWQRHEETNVIDWPCQVPGCPKKFPRRDKVSPHMSRDHGKSSRELTPCAQSRYGIFNRHCGLCGEIFREPTAFIDHVAKHWERKIAGPCTMEEWRWKWPSRDLEMGDADNGDGGDDDDDDDSNDGDNDQSDNNNDPWSNGPSYENDGSNGSAGPSNYYQKGSQESQGSGFGPTSGPSFGGGSYGHYSAYTPQLTRGRTRNRPERIEDGLDKKRCPSSLREQDQGGASRSSKLGISTRYEKFLIEGVSSRSDYREAVDDHCQTLLHSFTEPSLGHGLSSSIRRTHDRHRSRPSWTSYSWDHSRNKHTRKPTKTSEIDLVTAPNTQSRSRNSSRVKNDILRATNIFHVNATCPCQHQISHPINSMAETVSCPMCKRIICRVAMAPSSISPQVGNLARDPKLTISSKTPLQELQRAVWRMVLVRRVSKTLRGSCKYRRQRHAAQIGHRPKERHYQKYELSRKIRNLENLMTYRQLYVKENLDVSGQHANNVCPTVDSIDARAACTEIFASRNVLKLEEKQQTKRFKCDSTGLTDMPGCPIKNGLEQQKFAREPGCSLDPGVLPPTKGFDTTGRIFRALWTGPASVSRSFDTEQGKAIQNSFAQAEPLKRHLKSVHGVEQASPYSCEGSKLSSTTDEQLRILEMIAVFLTNSNVDLDIIRHRLALTTTPQKLTNLKDGQNYSATSMHSSGVVSGQKNHLMKPGISSLPQLLMSMNLRSTNKVKRFVQRTLSDCLDGAVTEYELIWDLPRIRSHVTAKAFINGMTGQIQIAMQLSTGASVLSKFISASVNRFVPPERLKEIARNSNLSIAWTGDDATLARTDGTSKGQTQVTTHMFQEVDKHVSRGGPVFIHEKAVARPLQLLTGMCGFHLQHALPMSGTDAMKPAILEETIASPTRKSGLRFRFKAMPRRLRQWRKKRSHSEIS